LNVVLLLDRGPSHQPQEVSVTEPVAQESGPEAVAEPPAQAFVEETVEPAEMHASSEPVAGSAATAGWTLVTGRVEHSLARTFQEEAGEDGDALTSVFTRLFVWDLDMRRDLQAGDTVAVLWRRGADGQPEIAAASLRSSKLGRTIASYHWQAPGDPFPSYWHLDGNEVSLRLKDGPIAQYEQITSLLKDRPTHKGMDFKTPVGTEVVAPRAGTVTRSNWNWKANGNCIEVRYDDGVLAKFLHLNENRVKRGDRVTAGQVIALTGNTGHSTAPHLHYQLDRGNKTLDPLDYHGTVRRSLDPEQVAVLRRDVAGFEAMLAENAGQ
jgi:murein DD-endopeptidase